MKKRVIWGFLILFSIATFAQTPQTKHSMNKYKQQWIEVENFEKQDLPQSASKAVDEILRKAIKEKNTPQVIKSLLHKNKYKIDIDNQENTQIYSDLENLLAETNNPADKALLHSMLAELYLDYLDNNSWNIRQRTNIVGFVPEDINEWSKNIFQDKALEYLKASVKDQTDLLNVTTKSYEDFIDLGSDSQRLTPTLYDFLAKRAINTSVRITSDYERNSAFLKSLQSKDIQIKDLASPTQEFINLDFVDDDNLATLQFYSEYLTSLTRRNINEQAVLTEIEKNTYLGMRSETYRTKYASDFLFALYTKNAAYDYNVEIIYAISNQDQYNIYNQQVLDNESKENITKIYNLLKSGIEKYPNYRRIGILKQKLMEIEHPFAELKGASVYHPDNDSKKFILDYKNINSAVIKIIDKKTGAVAETKKITLSPKKTYLNEKVEFTVDLNKIGQYKITAEYDGEKSSASPVEFGISKLAHFARVSGEKEYEFYIVDRLTGSPVSDATVTIYSADWNDKNQEKLTSVKTDSRGLANFDSETFFTQKNKKRYFYRVSKGNDVLIENNDFPYYYSYNSEQSDRKDYISIMTDRSIYRPGQTVYFKVISVKQADKNTTLPNKDINYTVNLYNTNNQLVSEQTIKTNDFGSLAGEFVLPQSGLTGQYRIAVDNTSQYFSVEEYKRPTFEVTFDNLTKTYTFGDQVKIKGHAENFSGIKLQDATVEYNIVKSPFIPWWGLSASETIDNGLVSTKDDGSFEIIFTIPKNDSRKSPFNNIFNFTVQASVTDLNGETQSGEINFVVGDVSMILSINIPSLLDKNSKDTIQVKATNLNGQPVFAKGTYTVYSVLPNDSINEKITTGNFSTDSELDLMNNIKKLPSAKYLISLEAKDDKNRDVNSRNYFVLYSEYDNNPPIKTNEWLIEKQTTFGANRNAEIIFGVSAPEATILYDILAGNKILDRQQFNLSNSNKKLIIPYKNEYDGNITVALTYVINEKAYTKQVTLNQKQADKTLRLKFEVFRDKLRPGQQEEWRISVKDNQEKPAFAELLASMYDSSLDKLRPVTPWRINKFVRAQSYPSIFRANSFGSFYDSWNANINYKDIPVYEWDAFNWFGFEINGYYRIYQLNDQINGLRLRGSSTVSQQYAPPTPMAMGSIAMIKNEASAVDVAELRDFKFVAEDQAMEMETGAGQTTQVRSNFNETAFFFPQLRTNENGETIISFTVPESNTSWKFRALAYDKELNTGTLEAVAVTRKELMVTPNLPRFVRHGDKTGISTKISNLSDDAISGKVRIEFFDPLTEQISNISIANQYQNFNLDKDASSSATWMFDVPSDIDMLGVRIIAESESFSDGEQHVLSVLPNRMMVTESMTMNVNGPQSKEFTFDRFVNNKSNTLSNYRLTLEYTGNPAWYAVQALPTLSNPTDENAVNWFASYYVNTLGSSIVQKYPKVANMIKAWKQQGGNKETLMSGLQKNQELKTVLLEETPWVLDAKDETEQMNRLSLLFDLNNTKIQTEQAIQKLKELQNAEGGWSWYKGMYSNRSVTQYILYGFHQLIELGSVEYSSEIKEMQMTALKYLDNQIKEDFTSLKKDKDWQKITSIPTVLLEYMFVRSAYRDIPIDQQAREAERFYTSVVEKNWTNLNLYERSLLVVLCQRNGNKELSDTIMKSVREHATVNEEMGMFWANSTSHVFMSRSAVAIHTFIMNAFKETQAPSKEMDMMKQWLLKQKQTQIWESTHATIDAVYALLSTGTDWLAASGESAITVGNQLVEPQNKESGTGYFKKAWPASEIKSDMGKVKIDKKDNGPAWGAMYWQYFEDLDKITGQSGELNVNKKIFVEKSTSTGKTLVEVTEDNPLNVGDKAIVRLTVRLDRDLEYVHLKDMRASCFEPIETISGLRWQNWMYYYQSTKDASTSFFFDRLHRGTYVFEYPVYVNRSGEYSNGITSIQCMYAPEFISHTAGIKITVK